MNPPPARPYRHRVALGVLLALSLLFMQWVGYAHAVAHAGAPPELEKISQTQGDTFDHAKSASACAALDATALGAGLKAAVLAPLPLAAAGAPQPQPLRSGWHRLFTAHFSTRAPPRNV